MPGAVYYAAPTYTYLQPTVTVIPHYLVQPNYVVHRTYLVRPPRIVEESPLPCLFVCGNEGYAVSQGQLPVAGAAAGWTPYLQAPVRRYSYRYRRGYYGARAWHRHGTVVYTGPR